jgi:hypothetical protein
VIGIGCSVDGCIVGQSQLSIVAGIVLSFVLVVRIDDCDHLSCCLIERTVASIVREWYRCSSVETEVANVSS